MVWGKSLPHELLRSWACRASLEAFQAKVRNRLLADIVVRILFITPLAGKVEKGRQVSCSRRDARLGSEHASQPKAGEIEVIKVCRQDWVPEPAGVAVVYQNTVMDVVSEEAGRLVYYRTARIFREEGLTLRMDNWRVSHTR